MRNILAAMMGSMCVQHQASCKTVSAAVTSIALHGVMNDAAVLACVKDGLCASKHVYGSALESICICMLLAGHVARLQLRPTTALLLMLKHGASTKVVAVFHRQWWMYCNGGCNIAFGRQFCTYYSTALCIY